MKIVTAEKYRHFTPVAPELHYELPFTSDDGSNTLMYQYRVTEASQQLRKELPSAFWQLQESEFQILIDGVVQKKNLLLVKSNSYTSWGEAATCWSKEGPYLYTYYKYLYSYQAQLSGHPPAIYDSAVTPVPIGATVLVKTTSTFDGWYHLDIRRLLIQGANPVDPAVLESQGQFQGGYRVEYLELENVKYGQLRRCDYQLGWDYKPPVGFRGIDSFSYALVTEFGQRSEPACCSIRVGY